MFPLHGLHKSLGTLQRLNLLGRRAQNVSTWTPLENFFNSKPCLKDSFGQVNVGLFGIPELHQHDGFYALQERVTRKSDRLIEEAISPNRSRKMVEVFDDLSDSLCQVADMAEFVRLAHPVQMYTHTAEQACVSVSGIVEKLNTHLELFQALKHVVDHGDKFPTTKMDDHVARLFLFDFEQCGIHLDRKARNRVVYLNDCILYFGQRFMSGAINPRKVTQESLPESVKKYFPVDGNAYLVSNSYTNSDNALARETAYRLFLYPDDQQQELLTKLLNHRHDLAVSCGFPTYAHRALKSGTVESPPLVMDFLDKLSEQLRPQAEADFHIMTQMKQADLDGNSVLGAWDTPYYTSQYKKEWLKVSPSEYAPYFSLGACMEGINNVMKALYGVRFEYADLERGETWSNDIYKLNVVHESEGLLGQIYCDFYERPGKPAQDCHFTMRGSKQLADGSFQNPIVVVMLNLCPPRWSGPTLLTPALVDNLFHEMGHAMHSMLARTQYQHVSGTRCSTDFAEVPSVLMEYFASDPRVLSTFARHFQTQEAMPMSLMKRLCISKRLFSASETQLQIFYSALDQVYHGDPKISDSVTTTDILKQVQQKYYSIPYVEHTAWQLRFSHLVGYGAKYYSYLVSKAISSSIWHTYFEADPFSRAQGERFRNECLSYGGSVPSGTLVENFLQQKITPDYLAKSLMHDIEQGNEKIRQFSEEYRDRN